MERSGIQRWLPLSGVLFAAFMVAGFAVGGSSPDSDDPDAKIATYLASTSKYHRNIAAIMLLWAACLFLLVFWATLRTQLKAAEGRTGGLAALTFGAGIAATVFNLLGISLFITPIMAAHDATKGHATLDPGIYRICQDIGYPVWIMTALIGSLAVWATATVVWRTRIWPRWYAWVSIVVGVICLFAIMFFPVLLFGLWIILTAILMLAKPAPSVVPSTVTTAPVL